MDTAKPGVPGEVAVGKRSPTSTGGIARGWTERFWAVPPSSGIHSESHTVGVKTSAFDDLHEIVKQSLALETM